MDPSEAFDCLPHDLLLLKLKVAVFQKMFYNYLQPIENCVKLGNFKSDYQSFLKRVPQGTIAGPVLFNIFTNDIFHFIKICNYFK